MYVCICHAVTDRRIDDEIAAGARTAEEIGERCRAGTGCGTCRQRIKKLLRAADATAGEAFAAAAG